MKLIKKVSRKIFPVYTKTFGGKIWIDLHSVSPSNFSGKNFSEVSFQIYHQTAFRAKKI